MEIVTFSSNEEFIKKWNTTDMTEYDDVIINTHRSPNGIVAKSDQKDDGIYIPDLAEKTVNSITLLSCNTGFIDEDNNAAKQFYDTMDVNFVVAPDGTLYNNLNNDEKNYNKVEVYSGNGYENYFEEENYREPEGFIMYYGNNETYSTRKIGNGPYYPDQVVEIANREYNKIR